MSVYIGAKVTFNGTTPELTTKEWKGVQHKSYFELCERFHERNLPWRFTYFGLKLLRMTRRSAKYDAWKRKHLGHNDPFVRSGETKKQILNNPQIRSGGVAARPWGRILLGHARKLNYIPQYSDELRRVAQREAGPLTDYLAERINANLAPLQETKTITVG